MTVVKCYCFWFLLLISWFFIILVVNVVVVVAVPSAQYGLYINGIFQLSVFSVVVVFVPVVSSPSLFTVCTTATYARCEVCCFVVLCACISMNYRTASICL